MKVARTPMSRLRIRKTPLAKYSKHWKDILWHFYRWLFSNFATHDKPNKNVQTSISQTVPLIPNKAPDAITWSNNSQFGNQHLVSTELMHGNAAMCVKWRWKMRNWEYVCINSILMKRCTLVHRNLPAKSLFRKTMFKDNKWERRVSVIKKKKSNRTCIFTTLACCCLSSTCLISSGIGSFLNIYIFLHAENN